MKGLVRKIIRFSAVDGPGNRAAVFLQGCNYNCTFCHNPETIARTAEEASYLSAAEVFEEIGSGIHFIRGITVSGGECTLQRDFLIALFEEAKKYNIGAMIDSNGSYDFSKDSQLLACTDGVMLDVKSMDAEEHRRITGRDNSLVLQNAAFLGAAGKLFEIRTVLSEDLLDCPSTVQQAAAMIAPFKTVRYKLIRYRPHGVRKEFLKYSPPSGQLMDSLAAIARSEGVTDVVVI